MFSKDPSTSLEGAPSYVLSAADPRCDRRSGNAYDDVPAGVDVLVTHDGPFGIFDMTGTLGSMECPTAPGVKGSPLREPERERDREREREKKTKIELNISKQHVETYIKSEGAFS